MVLYSYVKKIWAIFSASSAGDLNNKSLMEAAEVGNLTKVKEAIERGASLECRGEEDATPLYAAAYNGHYQVS